MLLDAVVGVPLHRAGWLGLLLPLPERRGPKRRCSTERRKDHDAGTEAPDDHGRNAMGLFDRLRGRGQGGGGSRRRTLDRGSHKGDLSHLEQFVASRRGVEGYVEPRTTVTETTILLVAADGEWTRRRVGRGPAGGSTGRGWRGGCPASWRSPSTTPRSPAIPSACATGPPARRR